MSRLTEKRGNAVCIEGVDFETCHIFCRTMVSCNNCPIDNAFRKLAHYEDLEEQGSLIEVVRCKDCVMESTCVHTQYQGEEGYCSIAELKGAINEQTTDTTL